MSENQACYPVAVMCRGTLRELGERGDIIKRMHRALTERGIERSASSYVLAGESLADPIVGRLIDRGLDDELRSTAYAVIDGTDGRTHHIKLPTLDAAGGSRSAAADSAPRFGLRWRAGPSIWLSEGAPARAASHLRPQSHRHAAAS